MQTNASFGALLAKVEGKRHVVVWRHKRKRLHGRVGWRVAVHLDLFVHHTAHHQNLLIKLVWGQGEFYNLAHLMLVRLVESCLDRQGQHNKWRGREVLLSFADKLGRLDDGFQLGPANRLS